MNLSATTQQVDTSAIPPDRLSGDKRRIPELDGLRGIAISLVLIHHFVISLTSPASPLYNRWIHLVLDAAWTGVDLFFVLSGFLLGGILLDNRDARNVLAVFYARRTLRIFPLYFAFLFAFALLQTFWHNKPANQFEHPLPLWAYAVYIQNIFMARAGNFGFNWLAPTWSLAVEEQFYLILPLLMLMLRGRKLVFTLATLIVIAPVYRWHFFGKPGGAHAAYVLLPCRWDALFLGVLGAYLMRSPGFVEGMRKRVWLFYASAAVFGILVVTVGGRASVLGYTWIGLFYLSLVFIALFSPIGWIKRILRAHWLIGLGIIAYGVYLIHVTVLGLSFHIAGYEWVQIVDWRTGLVAVSALAITLAIARISNRYFESPLIRRGHRFKYDRPVQTQVVSLNAETASPA
jgi:peptidoglycan/LPS O-acetylase OafA/YrhL